VKREAWIIVGLIVLFLLLLAGIRSSLAAVLA
jgi:hypothetical protein